MFGLFRFNRKKLVSIIIGNKNALSLLKGTIDSLKRQTYKNIEVIVIDGKSTDGSVEFLHSQKKYLNLKIISETDSGISEAYSKGLRQVTGDIVGILATDERYYTYTIKQVVKWFSKYPQNIVCGGLCKFLNEDEIEVDQYIDDYLDLKRHLSCEHICAILPSFFNKKILKEDLFYKTSHKTCPDYDLWARLALKYSKERFQWFNIPIVKALRTQSSMSFRASAFKQMVDDKISYLKEFLKENYKNSSLKSISFNRCAAGIHMWAAEQIMYIDYNSKEIIQHCNKAYLLDNQYSRILQFMDNNDFFIETKHNKSKISRNHHPQKQLKEITKLYKVDLMPDTEKLSLDPLIIKTNISPWGYSATISFDDNVKKVISSNLKNKYWVNFIINVEKGSVGIGKNKNNNIIGEKIIKSKEEHSLYFMIYEKLLDYNFLIRSGGEANSVILIKEIKLCQEVEN